MSDNVTFSTELLQYEMDMQPVSHLSEQITLTITRKRAGFCNYLIVYVPVGPGRGNIFTHSPSIKSSLANWSPVGSVPEQEAALLLEANPPPRDNQTYQRFIIYNQNPEGAVDSLPLSKDQTAVNQLVLTITGNVNIIDWTATFRVVENSKLAADPFVAKPMTCPVNKEQSLLVYIDSFVASTPKKTEDATTESGVIPVTKVLSGQPFRLSWASNGRSYELFQDGKSVAKMELGTEDYGQTGNAVFYEMPDGIFTDTSFVLQAKGPDETLYASLTVAVSNPTFSPVLPTLKQVLNQTDGAVLRDALERQRQRTFEVPTGDVLNRALAQTSDPSIERAMRASADMAIQTLLIPLFASFKTSITFQQFILRVNSVDLKRRLLLTSDPALKQAIEQTPDAAVKAALQDTGNPLLKILLAQPTDAALKFVLQTKDDATLIGLFDPSINPDLASAFQLVYATKAKFALANSPDTLHSLRVSDGTLNGNILMQALTGDNSGYASLNFNGYSSGGEKRFNDQKNRWRAVVDQRGTTDLFTIDTFDGTTPITPLAIATNGNVGIGSIMPAAKLTVQLSNSAEQGLRVTDGTTNSNIVIQPLTGGNSGFQAINFNGYYDEAAAGEKQFNDQKKRWRVGVDQRTDTDSFFIDAYNKGTRISIIDGNSYPFVDSSNLLNITSNGDAGIGAPSRPENGSHAIITRSGAVGIGTDYPAAPLHVAACSSFNFDQYNYHAKTDNSGNSSGKIDAFSYISILAGSRIVADEFSATSDLRLKTVIGLSDHAADLALLRRLRITDYTMRDRVQYGDQAFKKIIAQELEEVFPQAVQQHTSFLPDIYARPSQVQRQGEALLIILPTGLPEAATAGQRLKLIGPAGEVLATLAEAAEAGSRQLLVAGAGHLADTPEEVFVFGLEHADVRTVDYEAVAMLNVSATQALAWQVEELHQQNAALNEQRRAQGTQLNEMQAALHALQQQVAALLGTSIQPQPQPT